METTNISAKGAQAINTVKQSARYIAEKGLMATAITAKAIEQVSVMVQEASFNKAVEVRAVRKDIPQEKSAEELSKQLSFSLQDKLDKLKARGLKKQSTIVETEVLWTPKIV